MRSRQRTIAVATACSLAVLLSACGGGDGGAGAETDVARQAHALVEACAQPKATEPSLCGYREVEGFDEMCSAMAGGSIERGDGYRGGVTVFPEASQSSGEVICLYQDPRAVVSLTFLDEGAPNLCDIHPGAACEDVGDVQVAVNQDPPSFGLLHEHSALTVGADMEFPELADLAVLVSDAAFGVELDRADLLALT
jgi:hypothetical protein